MIPGLSSGALSVWGHYATLSITYRIHNEDGENHSWILLNFLTG